jgi:hypothetical protein
MVTRIKSDKRSEEVNEKTVDIVDTGADKEEATKKRAREDDGSADEAPTKRVDQKEEANADAS